MLENELIGKDAEEVVKYLGRPSEVAKYNTEGFTYNYYPGFFLPFGKFQAFFDEKGYLYGYELLDD